VLSYPHPRRVGVGALPTGEAYKGGLALTIEVPGKPGRVAPWTCTTHPLAERSEWSAAEMAVDADSLEVST
jgi:hypothetical protein